MYGHFEASCFSKIIGKLRGRRNFEDLERNFQDARTNSREKVRVVNESPMGKIGVAKRHATREPITAEPKIGRMSVKRILHQGEHEFVRRMDHTAVVPK